MVSVRLGGSIRFPTLTSLTAILNFAEDSMGTSADSLMTFGFKEYQVLVSRGQKVFAAVVFKGDLDKPMEKFIDTVESAIPWRTRKVASERIPPSCRTTQTTRRPFWPRDS